MKINDRVIAHIPTDENEWQDKDTIMQRVVLQLLIDFVEIEKGASLITIHSGMIPAEKSAIIRQNKNARKIKALYKKAKEALHQDSLDKLKYKKVTTLMKEIVDMRGFLWT